MPTDPLTVSRVAAEADPPLLWRVHGHYAGLDWDPYEGRYTASVPELPAITGHGRDRTAALRDLGRKLARIL